MNQIYRKIKLREDLVIKLIEKENNKYLLLSDPLGIAEENVQLPVELVPLLEMLDGSNSLAEIIDKLRTAGIDHDDEAIFSGIIEYLDATKYLESELVELTRIQINEYKSSNVRSPACADHSYPADVELLRKMIQNILNLQSSNGNIKPANGIIVPHIDFRTGIEALQTYSAGYQSIVNSDADLFVILGTSHYGNSNLFMLTEKDFDTPFGKLETDRDLIKALQAKLPNEHLIDDMAHRIEHSIEFQTIFIKYLFNKKGIKILPVLVSSLYNFIENKTEPANNLRYQNFIKALRESILESGKKAVFIASADMAHFGRKFEDDFDATDVMDELRSSDKLLIESLQACDTNTFFSKIAVIKDKWKICGLPPVYAMLNIMNPVEANFLGYGIWNEQETKSAVSFASLCYYI